MQRNKSMKQDYFFVSAPDGNYTTEEHPLFVNCSGLTEQTAEFSIYHPNGRRDYTLNYLHEGELTVSFGDNASQTLTSGAMIVVPPNVKTIYFHKDGDPIKVYYAHFTGNYANAFLEGNGISPEGCIRNLSPSSILANNFQSLLDEMKNPPDSQAIQRTAAKLILTLTELSQQATQAEHRRRLKRSFEYLHQNFTQSFSKSELAKLEGLGISQFNLLFHQITGQTPSQYVTRLRMNLACQLLPNVNYSIGDVAKLCGYDDMFYFSRVFKQSCGISPSLYRKGARPSNA